MEELTYTSNREDYDVHEYGCNALDWTSLSDGNQALY